MGSLMLFDLSVLANSQSKLLDDSQDGVAASDDFFVRGVVLGREFRLVFFIMLSLCWRVPTPSLTHTLYPSYSSSPARAPPYPSPPVRTLAGLYPSLHLPRGVG